MVHKVTDSSLHRLRCRVSSPMLELKNDGILHKIELEDDPETLAFGFMQLFDLMHPQGPAG